MFDSGREDRAVAAITIADSRDQHLGPAGPKASQRHPEKSIPCPKLCATTRALALKHEHLLAKHEQLRLQVSATANRVTNSSEGRDDDGVHRSTLTQSRARTKRSRTTYVPNSRKGQAARSRSVRYRRRRPGRRRSGCHRCRDRQRHRRGCSIRPVRPRPVRTSSYIETVRSALQSLSEVPTAGESL